MIGRTHHTPTPFSRERSVRFRRESADWSSASSRSTTPSGAEKATVSLSRCMFCNSKCAFLAIWLNPPPLGSKSKLKFSSTPTSSSPDPKAPSQASYLSSMCGGNKVTHELGPPHCRSKVEGGSHRRKGGTHCSVVARLGAVARRGARGARRARCEVECCAALRAAHSAA